ncbi:hypothetical protein BTJ49_13685 [Oleiagrimonas sp. MCCC 1A03011]|nr:hypothetical protein BTJ49_13685 [Oleiagrimonas sp. MCCC 1A03011]
MDLNQRDRALLQGTWEQTYLEADGIANPPDDEHSPPGALCSYSDDHFCVRAADGTILLEGHFTLDATTTPKSITWVDSMGAEAGQPLLAIYELTENEFVFVAADPGDPRPKTFRTGPGQTLRRSVRKA